MKLIPSQIEISEYEGFLPEKDIFQRKGFAEELSNLVVNVSDELVLALDAPWGEGKTTFVKMWRGMLKEKGVESIYFDAFENDYLEDPFLVLVGEIYSLLDSVDNKDIKTEFKTKAVSAIKTIGKAGIRIGLRAITAGVLDETILDGAGAEQELTDITDKYISNRLDALESDKATIGEFRKVLSNIPNVLGGENKVIIIIDELDRCKPSFALDLLEKIKHIFSVQGITFVLVMNRKQMDEIIKSRYGTGIDSAKYLQKFVHIWAELLNSVDGYASNGKRYLNDCLSRMDFEVKSSQEDGIHLYEELIDHYSMSLRDIERSLAYFAIIQNMKDGNIKEQILWLSIYLSIVKVLFPDTYRRIRRGVISYEDTLSETNLQAFEDDHWKEDKLEGHPLRWLLKYHLSNEDEVKELLTHGKHWGIMGTRGVDVTNICRWLETFNG
jgi:hypothetical protein